MTWPADGRRRGSAGFTLIEMLVVIAVVGLVLGLVGIRGPGRSPALQVQAAATALAGALRAARGRAIVQNRPATVTVDAAAREVRAEGLAPLALPPGIALAVRGASVGRGFEGGAIRFDPDGSASGAVIELRGGGQRAVVAVNWLTGRVTVSDAP